MTTSRSLFDNPVIPRLSTLLEEVRTGNIQIPDFQRPFVWDDDRRLLLLDSIAKGMPIGSFLVWRTRTHQLASYPTLGPFRLPSKPADGREVRTYLLDGHQRLSTLYAALSWSDETDDLEREGVRWPIYYDLEADASGRVFRLALGRQTPPPTWLPLSILFAPKRLFDYQKQLIGMANERAADRAEALANLFKDYQIPMVPLVTEDLGMVTESFVRVNNQGKAMRESHMVRALAYAQFDVQKLEELRENLAPLGWGLLDDQVMINALKIRFGLDVYKAGPAELYKEIANAGFESVLEELERSIRAAIEFFGHCGVRGPLALPYAYQFVSVCEAARQTTPSKFKKAWGALEQWFLATSFTGFFTGMTSSQIRDAVSHAVSIVNGTVADPLPQRLARGLTTHQQFNFTSARSRVFVLLLSRAVKDSGKREAAQEAIGTRGIDAVEQIFPTVSREDPANRVIADAKTIGAIRTALAPPKKGAGGGKALVDHLIPASAVQAARMGDYSKFLDLRRQEIERWERRWADEAGLS